MVITLDPKVVKDLKVAKHLPSTQTILSYMEVVLEEPVDLTDSREAKVVVITVRVEALPEPMLMLRLLQGQLGDMVVPKDQSEVDMGDLKELERLEVIQVLQAMLDHPEEDMGHPPPILRLEVLISREAVLPREATVAQPEA